MAKEPDSTAGFEQYLALGAGLHAIVDGIPDTAYPIRTWDELREAANSIEDVDLIVRGGKRSLQQEILRPNLIAIRRALRKSEYFPLENQEDFARKAGVVIMTLVVHQLGSPSPHESPNEQTTAEIEAFKRELAEQESTGRKAD